MVVPVLKKVTFLSSFYSVDPEMKEYIPAKYRLLGRRKNLAETTCLTPGNIREEKGGRKREKLSFCLSVYVLSFCVFSHTSAAAKRVNSVALEKVSVCVRSSAPGH